MQVALERAYGTDAIAYTCALAKPSEARHDGASIVVSAYGLNDIRSTCTITVMSQDAYGVMKR